MARSGRVDQNQSSSDSMSQARPAPKRAPTTMIQKGKEYRLGSLLRILIRQPSCRVQREVDTDRAKTLAEGAGSPSAQIAVAPEARPLPRVGPAAGTVVHACRFRTKGDRAAGSRNTPQQVREQRAIAPTIDSTRLCASCHRV